MKHQEFIDRLAAVNGSNPDGLTGLIDALPQAIADLLKADESLVIPGFGTFQIHKRLERIVENPATGRRTLTPPQLVLRFQKTLALHPTYSLHELAMSLCRRKGIAEEEALQFVAQCFGTIHEGLNEDGFASIVGLGTFQTSTDAGENNAQPSFIIDEKLAKLVNRPFAELPEVELNEGTDLHEFEAINAEFEQMKKEKQQEETAGQVPSSDEKTVTFPAEEASPAEETPESPEPDTVSDKPSDETEVAETTPTTDEKTNSQTSAVAEVSPETTVPADDNTATEPNNMVHWRRAAIVFAIAFIGLLIFTLVRWGRNEAKEPEPATVLRADSIHNDSLVAPAARTQRFTMKDPSEVYTHFETIGTLDEHTIVFGDILIHLAEHYYGNPYFVKYIIEYNDLDGSGNVPLGTRLKIPRLRRKPGF